MDWPPTGYKPSGLSADLTMDGLVPLEGIGSDDGQRMLTTHGNEVPIWGPGFLDPCMFDPGVNANPMPEASRFAVQRDLAMQFPVNQYDITSSNDPDKRMPAGTAGEHRPSATSPLMVQNHHYVNPPTSSSTVNTCGAGMCPRHGGQTASPAGEGDFLTQYAAGATGFQMPMERLFKPQQLPPRGRPHSPSEDDTHLASGLPMPSR
ncbi:hypothetical protein BJX68DRAFT_273223 [Aspergillus pseudodeflectus]|uniref:Uncharacterized protein n=1 Tax=Aspergillus pseudodeflectus TaxID=176178 RepID=A0ABR4JB64_9EURO